MICLCQNPLCGKAVDTIYDHSRIGERTFCGAQCATDWVYQNARFTRAAFPFKERPGIRKAYLSNTDPGDDAEHCRPQGPPEQGELKV